MSENSNDSEEDSEYYNASSSNEEEDSKNLELLAQKIQLNKNSAFIEMPRDISLARFWQ